MSSCQPKVVLIPKKHSYNFGPTICHEIHTNEAGPSHLQTLETIIDIHYGGPIYVIRHDNEARSTHQRNPENCHGYNFDARQYNGTNYSEAITCLFHTHIHVTGDQFSSTPFHVPLEQGASRRYTSNQDITVLETSEIVEE
ncbi:hypothetical protein Lal_00039674 [Lupinus albus]|nr:hypothetical protein Lal_00039674 [Lupinus albus]